MVVNPANATHLEPLGIWAVIRTPAYVSVNRMCLGESATSVIQAFLVSQTTKRAVKLAIALPVLRLITIATLPMDNVDANCIWRDANAKSQNQVTTVL